MADGPTNPNIPIGLKSINPLKSVDIKEATPSTKVNIEPVNKPGIETTEVLPSSKTELKSMFPPDNTYTPLNKDPTIAPELSKLRTGLKSIGLPDETVEEIVKAPSEHVPTVAKKSLIDKLPGPFKIGGLAALAILFTNIWKGIQSFFGKKDSGGSLTGPMEV